MVNGINNINNTSNIFAEMNKFGVNQVQIAVKTQKEDTVELSSKKPMSKKKKVIIGVSVAAGVILASLAFLKRKDICSFIKKFFGKGGGRGSSPTSPASPAAPASSSGTTQLMNGNNPPPQGSDGIVANVVSNTKDKLSVVKTKLGFDFDKLMSDLSRIEGAIDEKWVTENPDSAFNLINAAAKGEPFSQKQWNIVIPLEQKILAINTLISNKENFIEEVTNQYKMAFA